MNPQKVNKDGAFPITTFFRRHPNFLLSYRGVYLV